MKTAKELLSIKKYHLKKSFGGNGEKALERDGYKCVKCGMTNKQHLKRWNCRLSIDHIDGKGRYSKVKNHRLSNLQTMCLPCHGKKDRAEFLDGCKKGIYKPPVFGKHIHRYEYFVIQKKSYKCRCGKPKP